MADIPAKWEELVEHLKGTCKSLTEGLQAVELDEGLENDSRFCEFLDGEIMCCEECAWWVESHEVDDQGKCEDCSDGDD